jgi:hypothetical protein
MDDGRPALSDAEFSAVLDSVLSEKIQWRKANHKLSTLFVRRNYTKIGGSYLRGRSKNSTLLR